MSEYDATTGQLISMAQQALAQVGYTRNNIINISGGGEIANTPDQHANYVLDDTFLNNLQEPPKFTDFLGDDFNQTDEEIIRLNKEADAYMQKYFPAISQCLKTLPEEWLCGVISGLKPYGMDDTVFDMIWQKQRDRAHSARLSEQSSLEANMSSRGFSLPPGALVELSMTLSERGSDALQDVNRDVTIKQAEIKLDLLKFAEEQALRYKLGLMQAMADLYKVWAVIPDRDIARAEARSRAMAAYYQAIGSFYNVEVAFENLKLESEKLRVGTELENVKHNVAALANKNNDNGLGAAAQAFGNIAAGAASAASTLVARIESI